MTSLPKLPEPSELRDPPIHASRLTKQAALEIAERLLSEPGSMHVLFGGNTRSGAQARRVVEIFLAEAAAKFTTDGHAIRLENGSELLVVCLARRGANDRMTGITDDRNLGVGLAS